MDKFIDYYTLLNILPTANEELIKRAYRIQSKEMHPDQGGDERQFILLTEAYEILSNPIKRRAYDQEYAYYQRTEERTKERPQEEREKSNHKDEAHSHKNHLKFSFDYIRYGKVMLGALIGLVILAKAMSAMDDNAEPEVPVNPIVFPVEASEQSIDIPSDTGPNEELLDEKVESEAEVNVPSANITTDASSLYNRYLNRIYKLEEDLLSYGEVWESGSDAEIMQASYIQLKAWDDLLNEIYQTLKMELTDEEFIALRDLQRTWVVERDRVSGAAAVDFTGGSWEVPVYNDAKLEETRKRCYWLVMNYMK